MSAIRATRSTRSVDPWACRTSTATSSTTTNASLMYRYLLKRGERGILVLNLTLAPGSPHPCTLHQRERVVVAVDMSE